MQTSIYVIKQFRIVCFYSLQSKKTTYSILLTIHKYISYAMKKFSEGKVLKMKELLETPLLKVLRYLSYALVNLRIQPKYGKMRTRKNSVFWHFTHSDVPQYSYSQSYQNKKNSIQLPNSPVGKSHCISSSIVSKWIGYT